MIIPEKVRTMNKKEKFQYYVSRFLDSSLGENQHKEAVTIISQLMSGTPINKITDEFGVSCSFDLKTTPATLTISIPGTTDELTFDLSAQDRNQFEDPQPEDKPRAIKTFLTDDEQKELLDNVNDIKVNR